MTQITFLLAKDGSLNDIDIKLTDDIKTVGDFYLWAKDNQGKGKVETYQRVLNAISNK